MVEADEKTIRQYLLGEMGEAEMSRFEERLMTDDELFEMLQVVEDDLLDEAASHELSAEEQARFDQHFLATPDRRARLELSLALHDHARQAAEIKKTNNPVVVDFPPPKPEPRPSFWSSRRVYLSLAAAAVILVVIGLVVWPMISYRWDVSKGMAALNKAYTENPTGARITGLNYSPRVAERGGDGDGKSSNSLALEKAKGLLAAAAEEHPNAITYHAIARLFLAERDFDKAIQFLEEALHLDSNNAELHSDLGAALLEKGRVEQARGESGKGFEAFGQANEHLSKALELESSLLEALFNRALCREALRLYDPAKEDWRSYLNKDASSKWADEARQRLRALEERPPLTSQNRERLFQDLLAAYKAQDDKRSWEIINQAANGAVSFLENRLIDAYLSHAAKGQKDAAKESLGALSYIAHLTQERAGDRFVADLVRFYNSATLSQLQGAAQARELIERGGQRIATYNFDDALNLYERAKAIFEGAGDACETMYASYVIGTCQVQRSEIEGALSLFLPLARACEGPRYRRLLAQVLIDAAGAYQYVRAFSASMEETSRALKLLEEMGDHASYVRALFQLADEYRFINNFSKALHLHADDLSLAYTYLPQPVELWRNYFSMSRTFDQLDLPVTALDFQKQALRLTLEAQSPRLTCRCYNYLGMLLAKQGRFAEAAASIEDALKIGNSFSEAKVRTEATAYSFLQLGQVYSRLGDPGKAEVNYDQAIESYGELPSQFFSYVARKEKLLCCIEQGGCDSVGQDLETLLALFEAHRAKILEESNRNTFFGAEQGVYDVATEFAYRIQADPWKAFEYSEKGRARSLHDLIDTKAEVVGSPDDPDIKYGGGTQPMDAGTIQSRLRGKAQILQYAVLRNHLLIWVLSLDKGLCLRSQSVPIEDLNRKVKDFCQQVSSAGPTDSEALTQQAADLYDLLILPVRESLDSNEPLCIVPDKVLNYLPFAALWSRASKKYFIEEQTRGFVLSPSSTLFVICSDYAVKKGRAAGERLLSVGDPLFDRRRFADFDGLESAAREAEAIASYYGPARPLLGAAATKKRVMREMEQADVIHLATHAITDEWNPLRSKLLLAEDASEASRADDGVLQAHEIYKLNLERARLVVLSACRTAVGKYYGGEGLVGLSRAFIAKHIPLVVASLWAVNSVSTADLMIRFHGYRKGGTHLPTAEALRQAQIDMLSDESSDNRLPYHWAPFVAVGGYADF